VLADEDRDYKKLTFYFYAEQYVNFNELVTDLFKVWKLRIWLSAVNPASFSQRANTIRRPGSNNRMDGAAMPFKAANTQGQGMSGPSVPAGYAGNTPGSGGRGGGFGHVPPLGPAAGAFGVGRGMGHMGGHHLQHGHGHQHQHGHQVLQQHATGGYPHHTATYPGAGAYPNAMWQAALNQTQWPETGRRGKQSGVSVKLLTGPEPSIAFGALSSPTDQQYAGAPYDSETVTPTQSSSVHQFNPLAHAVTHRGQAGGGVPFSVLGEVNPIETLNARLSRLDVNASRP
jgi:PSP1 C-terminal conserved region